MKLNSVCSTVSIVEYEVEVEVEVVFETSLESGLLFASDLASAISGLVSSSKADSYSSRMVYEFFSSDILFFSSI
jgi:hypothetical protein